MRKKYICNIIDMSILVRATKFLSYLNNKKVTSIIMYLCKNGDCSVNNLSEQLHISQPETSTILNKLKGHKITKSKKEGHHVYYSIVPNKINYINKLLKTYVEHENERI